MYEPWRDLHNKECGHLYVCSSQNIIEAIESRRMNGWEGEYSEHGEMRNSCRI
jgi:hypothetical protein